MRRTRQRSGGLAWLFPEEEVEADEGEESAGGGEGGSEHRVFDGAVGAAAVVGVGEVADGDGSEFSEGFPLGEGKTGGSITFLAVGELVEVAGVVGVRIGGARLDEDFGSGGTAFGLKALVEVVIAMEDGDAGDEEGEAYGEPDGREDAPEMTLDKRGAILSVWFADR